MIPTEAPRSAPIILRSIVHSVVRGVLALAAVRGAVGADAPAPGANAPAALPPGVSLVVPRAPLADYDSEPRGPDGRVDVDGLAARLRDLGVTTYYWLIWHAPTDWEDLKLFLPRARAAGIDVWVYLVPPSESPPHASTWSEPFRLDFLRWAEEIAKLSLEHPNLTAWVIDDFLANRETLTPAAVATMQARAKAIRPGLAFLPLLYYGEVTRDVVEAYRRVVDGVVVAYPRGREEIEDTWRVLSDAGERSASRIVFPWSQPSRAGDFVLATRQAAVRAGGGPCRLRFEERDDFTGATSGYHFKQVLLDDSVVWEEDVAGGSPDWRPVDVDLTELVRGKASVRVGLRILERAGVSNFGVRWDLRALESPGLEIEGLQPPEASDALSRPEAWKVERRGAFETGFGVPPREGSRSFRVPFFVMTAGDESEFEQRHGAPATPERISAWLKMSLDAWSDGLADGVVTYCLDKRPESRTFEPVRGLFREARARRRPPRKLIEFGWDEPDTRFLREHIAEMEATPFAGCVFHVICPKPGGGEANFTWEAWGRRAFSEADLAGAVEDLKAIHGSRFRENFLRFNTTPADVDWFDDYGTILANARLAARVAKDGGCPGLLFDIEQYDRQLFDYRKQRDAATKPWDAYAEQVRRRGAETMAVFQEGYPDLVVFLTFGYSLPWVQTNGGKGPLADASYGLLAPFVDGLVEAARGETRIVDGYELSYGYREAWRFGTARAMVLRDLLPIVRDPAAYRPVASVGFGVWLDHDWRRLGWDAESPEKNYYSPEAFERTVAAALDACDEYVWIYGETPRWWSEAGKAVALPEAYAEALRRALAPGPPLGARE